MAASVDLEPRACAYGTLDGFHEPVDVLTQGDMLMHYDEAARASVKDAVVELRRLVQKLTVR